MATISICMDEGGCSIGVDFENDPHLSGQANRGPIDGEIFIYDPYGSPAPEWGVWVDIDPRGDMVRGTVELASTKALASWD